MRDITEEVENVCGHTARYTLTPGETGLEVGAEFDGDCETCREEHEYYLRHMRTRLEFFFGD